LTGPVVRGERATLERHLRAIEARAPELLEPYKLGALMVLQAAEVAQRIDSSVADEMRSLLDSHPQEGRSK
jgi:predicted short-subunit dehydrogenase-like oxidoreductase (DUF2520 family)